MGMSFENVKKVDNPNNPESSTNLQEHLLRRLQYFQPLFQLLRQAQQVKRQQTHKEVL